MYTEQFVFVGNEDPSVAVQERDERYERGSFIPVMEGVVVNDCVEERCARHGSGRVLRRPVKGGLRSKCSGTEKMRALYSRRVDWIAVASEVLDDRPMDAFYFLVGEERQLFGRAYGRPLELWLLLLRPRLPVSLSLSGRVRRRRFGNDRSSDKRGAYRWA